jgi:SAM-dependent methyltransferase
MRPSAAAAPNLQKASPAFSGAIPDTYHSRLGPLLFEPYARDIADRLAATGLKPGARVLELACGTGIVTRQLLRILPSDGRLTATDISEPMLAVARRLVPADPRLTFSPTDACTLPFEKASFDAIICQYGAMFFPDKEGAMREARRVLSPGGVYLFNVWHGLEHNPIPGAIQRVLEQLFPQNPPKFLHTPYGWHNRAEIERTVRAGGFTQFRSTTVTFPSEAPDAESAARAYLEGTPLALDLAERQADTSAIVAAASSALAQQCGAAPCRATMQAEVVEAR